MNSSKNWMYMLLVILISCWISGCNKGDASDELNVIDIGAQEDVEVLEDVEVQETRAEETQEETHETQESDTAEVSLLSVYVCGAVMKAGVYELEEGSRICDAIEIAGGMTEEAMVTYLNQAEILVDGQMLYVPTKEEAAEGAWADDAASVTSDTGLVNINTATKDELMTLTGIGESKAESIIDYRDTNGGFSSIEDIQNITGIKAGVFAQIEDEITV